MVTSTLPPLLHTSRELAHDVAERIAASLAYGAPLVGPTAPAPPSPRGDVVLGHLREGFDDPLALFSRSLAAHGDIVRLRFGRHFYYLLNDPEAIHRVLVENHRNYKKSRYHLGMERVMGQGLVTSDGDFWRRARRLAQPAFHRERIAAMVAVMRDATRALVERLTRAEGETLQLDDALRGLTFRIVCRALFGAEVEGEVDDYGRAAIFASDFANRPYYLPAWVPTADNREFARCMALFEGLVGRWITASRAAAPSGGAHTVLSMLAEARDEATGARMSDRQLRDEAMTLLLAGFETTSNALAWTFVLLSRHPEVEGRLRASVVEALGARDPGADDLPALGYVTQVLHESMRLYPPAWILERESLGEDRLGGYVIPPGTTVAACPWVLHRRASLWTDPERFDPDRFAPPRLQAIPRCAYLPFGAGPRVCIGNTFATVSSTVILAMVVRSLRLELVPSHPIVPEPATSLRLRHGVKVVPRAAPSPAR